MSAVAGFVLTLVRAFLVCMTIRSLVSWVGAMRRQERHLTFVHVWAAMLYLSFAWRAQ